MINNSQMMNFSNALVDTQYLDNSYDRLLTFENRLFNDIDHSIIKKTLAKKLADGDLTLNTLRNVPTRDKVLNHFAENCQLSQIRNRETSELKAYKQNACKTTLNSAWRSVMSCFV